MDNQIELIIAIVNSGYSEKVMELARSAGATGGTILHGRGTGTEEAAKFFGITIQEEKEIILIVSQKEKKQAIMSNIASAVGIDTAGHGITFSLPVEDALGVNFEGMINNDKGSTGYD